jgi:hypothetical protein
VKGQDGKIIMILNGGELLSLHVGFRVAGEFTEGRDCEFAETGDYVKCDDMAGKDCQVMEFIDIQIHEETKEVSALKWCLFLARRGRGG